MKKLLRFGLLSACIAVGDQAAGQFVSTGPNGGAVNGFYRNNSQILAAGSGGVYQSNDEGVSWQEPAGSPSIFSCDGIYSVAASGPDMYAGSRQTGVYRSSDGGVTWQSSVNGLRVGPGGGYTDIELNGPTILTLRADSGLAYVSNNQGISWGPVSPLMGNAFAQYISVNNSNFYVSTPQGLFSSPNGSAYTNINPSAADFGRLVWVNDTGYAATATGIKRSVDGGSSFITIALSGRAVRHVAVSGSNMYAVTRGFGPIQDTVLYSSNGGATFSVATFPASTHFSEVNDLLVVSGGLLVATDYGMYATRNNGSNWARADSGYHANTVRGIAVSGPYVIAGTTPMGIFRAIPDSGSLSWQHTGNRGQGVEGLINVLTARGAFVHAGGPLNYYRSTDTGATWMAGTTGVSFGNITSIYASPNSSDVWMTRSGNLYLSSNDGASFGQVVNSNLPNNQSLYVNKFDSSLYVATNSMLYKGNTSMVFNATSGVTGRVTSMARTADSTIWVATDGFGLYSSKTGTGWSQIAAPMLPSKVNALLAVADTLYAGTDNGVYVRSNAISWTALGLQDHVIFSLANRGGKLFVGTCSGAYSIPYKINVTPPSTSVKGYVAGGMNVFPNPADGAFTIRVQSSAAGSGEVVLRDILGVTVFRQSVALKNGINEIRIPATEVAPVPGIYLIQVTGKDLRATGRVLLR